MSEVWIATWFCLALADPICRRLEGAVGSITFDHSEMCEYMVRWGEREMRRLGLQMAGVCWKIGDVYNPLPRPKRL